MTLSHTQIQAINELLEQLRRSHYACEDCFYSCPKAEDDYCGDSERTECKCGADKYNAILDDCLAAIKALEG